MPSSPLSIAQNAHPAFLGRSILFLHFGEVEEAFTILVSLLPVPPPCTQHVNLGGETAHHQVNLAGETFPWQI